MIYHNQAGSASFSAAAGCPIQIREDVQPVLHTADEMERSGEDDWGIQ
jgi:hypothetical protein